MNAEQRQTAAECRLLDHADGLEKLKPPQPSPFIVTQPESWYSFHQPTHQPTESTIDGWLPVHTKTVYLPASCHPSNQ